jgi:hypothetical protein
MVRDGISSGGSVDIEGSSLLRLRGYWNSPWPAEDGGPRRAQAPHGLAGLRLGAGERLQVTSRDAFAATMLVLREPGELFLLRHTLDPRALDHPSTAWVERLDPVTLAPLARSADLAAGPFWPGGLAVHANGSLYVVFGRYCHRLGADLSLQGSFELPRARPYNSFVILDDGVLVMKDIGVATAEPARLTVLEPMLERACDDVAVPERSIARLGADGNTVYVVGDATTFRFHWDRAACRLVRDDAWQYRYRTNADQSYAWDPVLEGGHAWFMDNGDHDYVTTMLGAGRAAGPIHLFRVSLADACDATSVGISGLPHGTCTNPPLYDAARRVALGYDSGNGVLAAFRVDDRGALAPLWRRDVATAAHLLHYPDTGEVVVDDFRSRTAPRSARLRSLSRRAAGLVVRPAIRGLLSRFSRDDVVVLDVETGAERARASVPSLFQSVLFPAPGWNRDFYYCSFSTIARIAVS